MKIMNVIANRQSDPVGAKIPTLAFLGDSVTDGVFELKEGEENRIDPIYDKEHVYHNDLCRLLHLLYPSVSVNVINAGINGTSSVSGNERLEKDVLAYRPDLTVVCFGLNDVHWGAEKVGQYHGTLATIFQRLKAAGSEVIYMTPNMMNTDISTHINDSNIRSIAEMTCKFQNDGIFDAYIEAAKMVCRKYDVVVCDCYAKWKLLYENGVNITELLANKINHPSREMNWLFAISLLETMLQEKNKD